MRSLQIPLKVVFVIDINIVLMFYLALYPETFILSPNHPYPYPYEYEQVGDMSLLLKLLTH